MTAARAPVPAVPRTAISAGITCGSSSICMSTCCCSCRCCCGGARRAARAAARRVDLRAGAAARHQRGAAQAAVPRVAQPRQRLVHLQPLPAAHDLRLRAGLDARRVGLAGARAGAGRSRWRSSCCRAASRSSSPASIAHDTAADAVFANVFTWMWLLVFLGYGRAHLGFGNRLLALGARCQLPDLHPAPDRDHRDRVLRDSAALGAVDASTGWCSAPRC